MKLVYVAGPYRGKSEWDVLQNIRSAESVAADVWKSGLFAVCPHLNSAHFGGIVSDQAFLDGTMLMMERCDAVLLCPRWEQSVGTLGEKKRAEELDIPVFDNLTDLVDWSLANVSMS